MSKVPSIFSAPSEQRGNNAGYSPSPAASGYTPSAAASHYNPSGVAASGYVPSAAATSYTPSAAASSYTPSAAATGYTPSTAATSYTPSAAVATSYTPSAAATSYTPSAAAMNYNPSGGYASTATAPTPPFSQALNVPPPLPSQPAYQAAPMTRTPYYPSAAADNNHPGKLAMVSTTPSYPVATAIALASSYTHGNGPTHGIVTQTNQPIKCHKIDYEIKGQEMQLVEIHLDPQETVVAEAGAMMYLENDIDFKTKFGDGSEPKQGFFKKLMAGAGRLMTGESLFLTHFTNTGSGPPRIAAFAAPYPGTILPIDMMELQQRYPSGIPDKPTSLICQKDAFLCAAKGTKLEMHLHKKIGSGLFGGEGFIFQKIQGMTLRFVCEFFRPFLCE